MEQRRALKAEIQRQEIEKIQKQRLIDQQFKKELAQDLAAAKLARDRKKTEFEMTAGYED